MLTLGIETSCDETSVAVLKNNKVLSCIVLSSMHLHVKYGGIVPEIATRKQVEFINHVFKRALLKSKTGLHNIDLISVTQGPGLIGSLLVGISFAKALSLSLGIPIIGVNHVISHIFANFLTKPFPKFPFIGLVISGGHTCLIKLHSANRYKLLGQTQDDAVGEAFDKVSKILGLGYPGGPAIEKRAKGANSKRNVTGSAVSLDSARDTLTTNPERSRRVSFPSPALGGGSLDFSLSGIKTAVLYHVKKNGGIETLTGVDVANIAAGFEDVVCEAVAGTAIRACLREGVHRLAVGGGVSANLRLRRELQEAARRYKIKIYIPPLNLCLDNGAMTAAMGAALHKKGICTNLDFSAYANFQEGVVAS